MSTTTKAAVVTGGAQGLGRAICLALAARGWRVAVADRDAAGAEAASKACIEAGAPEAPVLVVDLATPDGPAMMVDAAIEQLGAVDGVVNNAGYATIEPFLEMTVDGWTRTLDVNVRAVAMICSRAGRHMAERGTGRIVNITSPASRMALPDYLAYSAGKAAVDSITRAAAIALAPRGVRVNSVAPGMMDTALQAYTERLMAVNAGRENDMERFLAERTARIPVGHRTTPEEVASAVVWLLADAPDHIVAERLNISGGLDKD
ncbi:MAG: SDR family oxidoreductase [Ectothiorhodospiraceae bacterium]|nr:SDR family oxidoreductase [Chromatiales bacterium]MCP5154325.1 SDR family oxidoreductase [Ectothiorhodospiraceae bacterium]